MNSALCVRIKTLDVLTVPASASLPPALMAVLPLVVLALPAIFALALALALAHAVALAPFLRPFFEAVAVAPAGLGGGVIAPASTRASKSFRPLTDFPVGGLVPAIIAILSFAHDSVDPTQLLVMHLA